MVRCRTHYHQICPNVAMVMPYGYRGMRERIGEGAFAYG